MNQKRCCMKMPFFWGGSNKHCRSQPAGAKICLLVLLGEVENLFVGNTRPVPRGVFCWGKEGFRLEAVGCCCGAGLGMLGTLAGGVRMGTKSLLSHATLLGAAERDMLMPVPALAIPGGFACPALRALGCSAEGGHHFQTQKSRVFCFLLLFLSPVERAAWLGGSRGFERCSLHVPATLPGKRGAKAGMVMLSAGSWHACGTA